ncbi:homoserine kinase [Staphylospora marina]|uniref:homoserine kinase n=1 Tax=Staphylospora marina TaxID=2490858 RepID=UPI000F5BFAB6|nr:homoserine kinase [Staphylospora marina]
MSQFQPFRVITPCSTANLGPGFDSLGMALSRYLMLSFAPSETRIVEYRGEILPHIPLDDRNLIIRVIKEAFADAGKKLPEFRLVIENEIPLVRGLGSSAAAIVGALVAANQLLGRPWSQEEILDRATRLEGHPDNVGASLVGGVVVTSWDGKKARLVRMDPPELPVVAVIPKEPLSTKLARQVLPSYYSREEAVLSSSRANLLVASLATGRWDLLSYAMKDGFHQPYRERLVPGLKDALRNACRHGALGVALSGAGPTIISFAKDPKRVIAYFESVFQKLRVPADVVELRAVSAGATVETVDG